MNLALALSVGMLTTVGVWFLLGRTTFRVVVGLLLLGYATNFVVATSGGFAEAPPLLEPGEAEGPAVSVATGARADPLAQALVLTAIVITLGMTLYLLALVVARDSDGTGSVVEPLDHRMPSRPEEIV